MNVYDMEVREEILEAAGHEGAEGRGTELPKNL